MGWCLLNLSIRILSIVTPIIVLQSAALACGTYATSIPREVRMFAFAKTVCDGQDGFTWMWMKKPEFHAECFGAHEQDHVFWLKNFVPAACAGRERGSNPVLRPEELSETECHAFKVSLDCLSRQKLRDRNSTSREESFVVQNIQHEQMAIANYCRQGTSIASVAP